VYDDTARTEAKDAADAVRRDRPLGPLHGVPFAVKDLIDVRGRLTSAQTRGDSLTPARRDAAIVARLRQAGAILLGKLNLEELGIGAEEDETPWPAARNPWAPDRTPGGSSSGAGVAVAAGLAPLAIGTDSGGSVRLPAALCGIVGFKPRYGAIDRRGLIPLAPSLDHLGWMTRSAEDSRIVLSAFNGPTGPPPPLEGIRVGVIRHFFTRDLPASPEIAAALEGAFRTFAELGAELAEVETEPAQVYERCGGTILSFEAYDLHGCRLANQTDPCGAGVRAALLAGSDVTRADYDAARRERRRLQRRMRASMARARADVLATAVTPGPAWTFGDPAGRRATGDRSMRMTFNVLGYPALALPIGFTADGLPLAMQLAAPPGREALILELGTAYQRLTSWHQRTPFDAVA
jgi:aspartyl-tRNA(Asn)/glutamyl-tRNA(Gln) amidotransferase subunit A